MELTRTEIEGRLLTLTERRGLPRPAVNACIEAGGQRFECDFVWSRQRLVVETDGRKVHGTSAAFERDRTRDRKLQVEGWRVVRITWRQIVDRPEEVGEDLERLLGARRG